jgi:hypothetical protein
VDFDTSGIGKWRRKCFGSESPEIPKVGKSDRWQESTLKVENHKDDRRCVFVNWWSQTLLTVLGFEG